MLLNIRFLEKKAKAEKIDIPDQALAYIAIRANNRVRDLEGALSRVVAYSELAGEKITANAAPSIFKPRPKMKNQSIIITDDVSITVANMVRVGLPSLRIKLMLT